MKRAKNFLTDVEALTIIIAIITLIVIFTITSDYFFTFRNFQVIINNMSMLTLLSLGLLPILIAGEIDISFSAAIELSAIVAALASPNNIVVLILLALVSSTALGLLNGFLTVKIGLPSFLATLATMTGVQGLVLILANYRVQLLQNDLLTKVFYGKIFGSISTAVLWALAGLILVGVILRFTRFGKWIYSTGGNEKSSMLMGVPTKRIKFTLFVMTSIFAGIAGLIAASRSAAARPGLGEGYLMSVIAAPILGGASLNGGTGSVGKTVLACAMLTILINGVNLIGLEPAYQSLFMAFLLVGSLSIRRLKGLSFGTTGSD